MGRAMLLLLITTPVKCGEDSGVDTEDAVVTPDCFLSCCRLAPIEARVEDGPLLDTVLIEVGLGMLLAVLP